MRDDEFWYYVSVLEDVEPPGTYLIARGRTTWAAVPMPEDIQRLCVERPEYLLLFAEDARRGAEHRATLVKV